MMDYESRDLTGRRIMVTGECEEIPWSPAQTLTHAL